MNRQNIEARIFRSFGEEQRADRDYWKSLTPAQRLAMMWQLTIDAWSFKGEPIAESRLPRHVVRVYRRGR